MWTRWGWWPLGKPLSRRCKASLYRQVLKGNKLYRVSFILVAVFPSVRLTDPY